MRRWTLLLSVLLGLASAAPAQRFGFTRQMLPVDDLRTRSIALGDVDGDGDVDAFVSSAGVPIPGPSRLYLNDGGGVFEDVTGANLPGFLEDTRAVALGDLDGDGDLDAFVGNVGPNRVFLNDGSGVLTDATSTNLPTLSDRTNSVSLGDVDGDGDLDVLVGNGFTAPGGGPPPEQNRLYLNDGSGTFTDATSTNLPALFDFTTSVVLGDVDADGDLDAFTGNHGQPNRLYLNDGTGTYLDVTATHLPPLIDNTTAIALGDLDGDGDLDAFVGNGGFPGWQNRLHVNTGAGVFIDVASGLPSSTDNTWAIALGDVDGDGDLDALVGNQGQDRLFLNDGSGMFTNATATHLPGIPDDTGSVSLADVDGDGDLDALIGTGLPQLFSFPEQDRLYLNDGTGSFSDATARNLPSLVAWTNAVALGDVDGDGDLDAVAGITLAPGKRVLRNDGTGAWTDVTTTSLGFVPTEATADVALGDADGDGDLDLFVANGLPFFSPSPEPVRLYSNTGSGAFSDVTAASLPFGLSVKATCLELGDVDGDGDVDAFVGRSGPNVILTNSGVGSGTFTAANIPYVDYTLDIALGDVDGDGFLDAFVANAGQNRLYRNSGVGPFLNVTGTHLPSMLDTTSSVALGDVDGDGDLDAFLGNGHPFIAFGFPEQNRLYLNGGTGVFTDVTATSLSPFLDHTVAVSLADLDGDGDLDAFVANYSQRNRLLRNDGTGHFADITASSMPNVTDLDLAVAMGDVDGDGDVDAIAGVRGQDRLYTNLTRQLVWRGIPRVGKPLTLDVYGPSWGAWFLAFSTGTASVPIPPFGTLRLDPANLNQVFASLLDAQGRASITFAVPANAALVGASVYWQAVVASPARFTNLEITTLTNL